MSESNGGAAFPWCIPDGEGNEHLICAGDDPANPGRILLVLQGARGTRSKLSYEDIAECNRRIVTAVNTSPAVADLVKALEECRATLAMLTEPKEIRSSSVQHAWAHAVDAERKARSALSRFRELEKAND
jgi:hypothetical protein